MHKLRIRQSGQAIVAVLIIMLLSVAGLVLMYNTGQATSEKLRVVNAADAAAYSGGVWVARQLNFMAYTNRAMIANHVAVGHFVSFASWLENTEENLEKLDTAVTVICAVTGVGCVLKGFTSAAENGVEIYRKAVDALGNGYVSGIDLFNQGLYFSQVAARANLNPLTINDVMQRTARDYGDVNLQVSNLQVNNADDLLELARSSFSVNGNNSQQGTRAAGQVGDQFSAIFNFISSYEVANDDGRAADLVEASLDTGPDSPERWIRGDRGWRLTPFPFRVLKSGSTVHTSGGATNECNRSSAGDSGSGGLNWYAKDELELQRFSFSGFRPRFRTFIRGACADVNATDFDSSYKGIDNYYALNNQNSEHHTLSIYAYATLDTNATAVPVYHTFRDVDPADPHYEVKRTQALTANKTTALVEAQVFHGSDEEHLFSTDEGEYANLFNPYWHARSQYGVYDKIATVISGINGNN